MHAWCHVFHGKVSQRCAHVLQLNINDQSESECPWAGQDQKLRRGRKKWVTWLKFQTILTTWHFSATIIIRIMIHVHSGFFHSIPSNHWGPHFSRGWCTKDQLLALYNGNRPLVEQLITSKTNSGEYREHPDMPNDPGMTLYYVLRINIRIQPFK